MRVKSIIFFYQQYQLIRILALIVNRRRKTFLTQYFVSQRLDLIRRIILAFDNDQLFISAADKQFFSSATVKYKTKISGSQVNVAVNGDERFFVRICITVKNSLSIKQDFTHMTILGSFQTGII